MCRVNISKLAIYNKLERYHPLPPILLHVSHLGTLPSSACHDASAHIFSMFTVM